MNRIITSVLAVLAVASTAHAEPNHNLLPEGGSVGLQAGYYRYSENPKFMELESKQLVGLTGAYQSNGGSWNTRLEGRFMYAPADYASSQGTSKNETNYSFEGRALLTHETDFPSYGVAPYIGLGYRMLRNDGKDVNGYSGYTRVSQYLYVPAGVWAGMPLGDNQAILGQAEVGALLAGVQYSGINGGLYNDQKSGQELRLSAAYRNGNWQVGPYAQFWHVKNSTVDCAGSFCGYEPKNFTREAGVELTYHF